MLIPFTAACVPIVDVPAGRLIVVLPDEVVVAPESLAAPNCNETAAQAGFGSTEANNDLPQRGAHTPPSRKFVTSHAKDATQ
jgi:hypothetical protein